MRSRKLLATGLVLVVMLATFSVAAADVPGPDGGQRNRSKPPRPETASTI